MQQLPTAWVNPDTTLVIGAGAFVNSEVLRNEIKMVDAVMGVGSTKARLLIDYRASTHGPQHTELSSKSGRHHSIGATGKGCSEAIVDKIRNRNNGYRLFADTETADGFQANLVDTERELNEAYDRGDQILLEGTQGAMLDLHLGPYPYTTHKQTTASNWLSEAGLSPALKYEICLVVRTYPIRVAGNSGPMPGEISWYKLAGKINDGRHKEYYSPIVQPWALMEYADACLKLSVSGKYHLPPGGRFDFHAWPQSLRDEYRVAVSEFHAEVLRELPDGTVKELKKLFELTTVTGKLRRVAGMDIPLLLDAIRQNRPSYVALTFLNYVFPELWEKQEIHHKAAEYLDWLEGQLGVPIKLVSTGPRHEHILAFK